MSNTVQVSAQDMQQARNKANLLNDLLFKYVFGREQSKKTLIAFLNVFLRKDLKHKIKSLRFSQNEQVPDAKDGKSFLFDIACVLDSGAKVEIEVQVLNQHDFRNRITI